VSSVLPPNKSDNDRTAVDSSNEQPGGGTEGTGDRLNEAPRCKKLVSRDSWHFHTCNRPAKWLVNGKPRCGIHGKSRTRVTLP